ncbi:uncharacterized protein K460DRAFT_400356 [Cucurbitaria berberidis CBS 394.84]|uniref:Uncharacterized protein n=1 Tax=Cucurbitaria berberidis CBS 394.84 TaxID=1168544 RepID=A0A9P4GS46_9PLEO|nr:uncharacterized protein K460DRAFT_400356 [Cucurbitaria berberidis CBS 394.84]KAF1850284.1 hypothetical protein K460DRAFT_400356 [Cucurbitaria berberidis CBS 394.84]
MPSPTQVRLMFRTAARSLSEPHPFARNPVTSRAHQWRAGDLSKRVIKTSTAFVPFYVAVLGWPVAAAWWFNGNM